METLKLVFYILGSAAFLGLIIFFIALIFNKDDGIDLEQGRINYLSREVDRLDKKISNEAFTDNQHGKETEGKKCPLDLYSIDTEIKSFSASDLIPTERDVELALQKQGFDLRKNSLIGHINALKEKNKQDYTEFEAKEKKYVEKIRQLEKILVAEDIQVSADGQVTNMKTDKLKYEKFELNLEKSNLQNEVERLKRIIEDTEKRRTEAYDLIANVYEFEQTIMPEYGRYNAGAIDISEIGKNLESTFREYFRREKKIKQGERQAKVVATVTEEDENILDIVDKILAEEKTKGSGYNTVTTLKNKKSK